MVLKSEGNYSSIVNACLHAHHLPFNGECLFYQKLFSFSSVLLLPTRSLPTFAQQTIHCWLTKNKSLPVHDHGKISTDQRFKNSETAKSEIFLYQHLCTLNYSSTLFMFLIINQISNLYHIGTKVYKGQLYWVILFWSQCQVPTD